MQKEISVIKQIDPLPQASTRNTPTRFKQLKHADYLTPEVELLGYEAIKRVCYACFDEE